MAIDYFLKLDGIEGESKDDKHKNEIDVTSFSFGAEQTGTSSMGGGAGAGKVKMSDFHFNMPVSKASPKLMLACASGQHIKSAVFTLRKAGKEQQDYMTYTFSDLLISKWQDAGLGDDQLPHEEIAINFSKIEISYKEQQADGTLGGAVKAGYDLKANKAT